MRIGVTGHQRIPWLIRFYVAAEIGRELARAGRRPEGFTSLAQGADQIFAERILARRGRLHVIVPSVEYESAFHDRGARRRYRRLLARAKDVETLPFAHPSREAFLQAGRLVVDSCELLLAVYDGAPADGKGGAADVVAYAKSIGVPTRVIWKEGVSR